MTGKLKDLTINRDGTQNITVTVDADFREEFDELFDKEITVDIKKFSKKRSLNANAYAWVLIDKISEKTGINQTEVYRSAIREIGGIADYYGMKESVYETFCDIWTAGHLGRQVEIIPGSAKPGWINVKAWKGSSDFDSAQMARFIDSLIQDAEALGIVTITPKEQKRLIEQWGAKVAKRTGAA